MGINSSEQASMSSMGAQGFKRITDNEVHEGNFVVVLITSDITTFGENTECEVGDSPAGDTFDKGTHICAPFKSVQLEQGSCYAYYG